MIKKLEKDHQQNQEILLKKGKGWGMNTHVGIIGATKGGKPIIFHNISGTVYGDPIDKIRGNSRIAWIKRAPGSSIANKPSSHWWDDWL